MKGLCHVILVFFCFYLIDLRGEGFSIQRLERLADQSQASCINNHNIMIGKMLTHAKRYDFLWKLGGEVVCLSHKYNYQSPIINNNNQVVGIFWDVTKYWFVNNTQSKHIYMMSVDGAFKDIGFPSKWKNQVLESWQVDSLWDSKELALIGFNDHSQILLANSFNMAKATEFAVWEKDEFQYLEPHVLSAVYGINNDGIILGQKLIQKNGEQVPMLVLYDFKRDRVQEVMEDAHLLRRGFNDLGQVIVVQGSEHQKDLKGLLWTLEEGFSSFEDFIPMYINNFGQVVGVKATPLLDSKMVVLLWEDKKIINLSEEIEKKCVDSMCTEIRDINGINDNGCIIGQGVFDGEKQAFVIMNVK